MFHNKRNYKIKNTNEIITEPWTIQFDTYPKNKIIATNKKSL